MGDIADVGGGRALALAADRIALEPALGLLRLAAGRAAGRVWAGGLAPGAAVLVGVVGRDGLAMLVLLAGVLGGVAHRRVVRTRERRGVRVLVFAGGRR